MTIEEKQKQPQNQGPYQGVLSRRDALALAFGTGAAFAVGCSSSGDTSGGPSDARTDASDLDAATGTGSEAGASDASVEVF
jgi:hypothetical protein